MSDSQKKKLTPSVTETEFDRETGLDPAFVYRHRRRQKTIVPDSAKAPPREGSFLESATKPCPSSFEETEKDEIRPTSPMSASVSLSSKFQLLRIHIEPDSARPKSPSQLPSSPDSQLHQLTLLFQDLTYGLEETAPIEKQAADILNRGLSHPNFIMKDFWNSYRVEINTWIRSRQQAVLMSFKAGVEMGPIALSSYIKGVVIGKEMAELKSTNGLLDLCKKAADMAIQEEICQKQSDEVACQMSNALEHLNSVVRGLRRVVSSMLDRSESIQPPPSRQILYQAPSRESSSEARVGGPDTSDSSYRAKRRTKRKTKNKKHAH
ncbi:uncharacterized protein LOC123988600 [Osmia bicornis bicornis]|uniref:uncharacterized protein LOC123988600 n=1 Tax=Osmia bicornis bicornis TaxID=1437191 RepID=UPI001EAEE775|nr:uncharacterized protein LOC123988600 [Osmia bicornis bicornis]